MIAIMALVPCGDGWWPENCAVEKRWRATIYFLVSLRQRTNETLPKAAVFNYSLVSVISFSRPNNETTFWRTLKKNKKKTKVRYDEKQQQKKQKKKRKNPKQKQKTNNKKNKKKQNPNKQIYRKGIRFLCLMAIVMLTKKKKKRHGELKKG